MVVRFLLGGLLGLMLSIPAAAQQETVRVAAAAAAPGTLDAHLRTALRPDHATDAAIRDFYAARGGQPFWSAPEAGAALRQALQEAPLHALPPASPATLAAFERAGPEAELALMRAYLAHARRMTAGVLDPRRIDRRFARVPPVRPARLLLDDLARASDIPAHLAQLAPAHPDYAVVQRAYRQALDTPSAHWGRDLPAGPTLRQGDRGERVLALRTRLAALDMAPVGTPADPALFDAALDAAVRRFQDSHGLNVDGAVGPATRGVLNVGPADRIAKLAVTLERLRWTNMPLGPRHIVVNLADFSVRMVEHDRIVFDERVVIGRLDRQTPEFSDVMDHLVFNPTWFIPRSIAVRDILPRLHEDPSYLARSNMMLTRPDGGPLPENTSAHDFTTYTARDFPYRIRQRPDPDNALGQVKFMFPNNHAIYLHDTPARNLFLRDSRAYSSGCVRVRDPMRLAALLLAPQMADPDAEIARMLESGRERYVHLREKVPVHLDYRTAIVEPDGRLRFRADIYGRDAMVAEALRAAGIALP